VHILPAGILQAAVATTPEDLLADPQQGDHPAAARRSRSRLQWIKYRYFEIYSVY